MDIFCNSHVAISNNTLYLNGKAVVETQPTATDLLNTAYQQLNINYPKFFKMDNLCKTGFIATELLLGDKSTLNNLTPFERGIVLSTKNSSLDTDLKYQTSTQTNPSPALFVYTLPNVLIGELCIRNGIKGESACFVFDNFDADFQTDYVDTLLQTGNTKVCISGWADFYNGKAEAFFYLAECATKHGVLHNAQNIKNIYTQIWKN